MSYDPAAFTQSDNEQLAARFEIRNLLRNNEIPEVELERSMFCFTPSAMLARLLGLNELYLKILNVPGSIFDFGTWRGQNIIVCENLRAIYEPFNKQRRIFGFDTFEGYSSVGASDSSVSNIANGKYSTECGYEMFLRDLVGLHEKANIGGGNSCGHKVLKGDVGETLPALLEKNLGETCALSLWDMNVYQPTFKALVDLSSRLEIGGIVAFFQYDRAELQGEARAFIEFRQKFDGTFKPFRCRTYPSLVAFERVR